MKKITAISLFSLITLVCFAQEKTTAAKNVIIVRAIIENGDTLPYLMLPEVEIVAKRTFKNDKEKANYYRLVWNVKKTYPYAVLAGVKLKQYNNMLARMPVEAQRKIYMKKAEKELKDQFESDLKKLSITQGRILIKLIDRETGNTSYALVQELRGNFSAFMWQSLARLFGNNLKTKYDPTKGEDKQIEQIIHQIEDGVI